MVSFCSAHNLIQINILFSGYLTTLIATRLKLLLQILQYFVIYQNPPVLQYGHSSPHPDSVAHLSSRYRKRNLNTKTTAFSKRTVSPDISTHCICQAFRDCHAKPRTLYFLCLLLYINEKLPKRYDLILSKSVPERTVLLYSAATAPFHRPVPSGNLPLPD